MLMVAGERASETAGVIRTWTALVVCALRLSPVALICKVAVVKVAVVDAVRVRVETVLFTAPRARKVLQGSRMRSHR